MKCGEAIVDGDRHGVYLICFGTEDADNLSADEWFRGVVISGFSEGDMLWGWASPIIESGELDRLRVV